MLLLILLHAVSSARTLWKIYLKKKIAHKKMQLPWLDVDRHHRECMWCVCVCVFVRLCAVWSGQGYYFSKLKFIPFKHDFCWKEFLFLFYGLLISIYCASFHLWWCGHLSAPRLKEKPIKFNIFAKLCFFFYQNAILNINYHQHFRDCGNSNFNWCDR